MNTQNLIDNDLVKRIYDRIKWDIRVNSSDVLVKATNGCVVLSGYFDKAFRRAAVVDIVCTTEGVHELQDLSQVVNDYYRTDEELKKLLKKQIGQYEYLPGEWIDLTVMGGVVTLEGAVYRPSIKAFAGKDCWALSGVNDCMNIIEVKPPTSPVVEQKWRQYLAPVRGYPKFAYTL